MNRQQLSAWRNKTQVDSNRVQDPMLGFDLPCRVKFSVALTKTFPACAAGDGRLTLLLGVPACAGIFPVMNTVKTTVLDKAKPLHSEAQIRRVVAAWKRERDELVAQNNTLRQQRDELAEALRDVMGWYEHSEIALVMSYKFGQEADYRRTVKQARTALANFRGNSVLQTKGTK